ncbi:MAG: restriction endonuclease [Christensenellales bacterium]
MKKPFIIRFLFCLLFIVLLPLFIISGIFNGIIRLVKHSKWKKNKFTVNDFINNSSIEKIDIMQGYQFETFLKTMFFYLGYNVETTARTGDYGADLVLNKDGVKIVVQAKRYSKNVNSKSVQEVLVAKTHYNATECMVVTNSQFTKEAEQVAYENNVILVDRTNLISLIGEAKDKISELYGEKNVEMQENMVAFNENFDNNLKFRI